MKTMSTLKTLAGISVMLFGLGVTGAKAQAIRLPDLSGTFTLSHNAIWGTLVLPAGSYRLQYGYLAGINFVEVSGTEKGSPHGIVPVKWTDKSHVAKTALVCFRVGETLVVRSLEMAKIGEEAAFPIPSHEQLMAKLHNGSKDVLLAQAPMLIQRIPVSLAQN